MDLAIYLNVVCNVSYGSSPCFSYDSSPIFLDGFRYISECSISRGWVLARCSGFGTCGWTDVGGSSSRSRLWDLLPWRYDSWERPQRPVECPITLARGRFERADSERPSSGSAHITILCKTEREARWLDLVARDKPPDNLMPRAVLCWLDQHMGPGPAGKGSRTLVGT